MNDATTVLALADYWRNRGLATVIPSKNTTRALLLKGDWNVDPNQVVQANPTLFFEPGDLPRWLWSLLSSFDLFSLWTLFILATGYAVASKRELSTGLWGVGIPWAMFLLAKTAFLLMFS